MRHTLNSAKPASSQRHGCSRSSSLLACVILLTNMCLSRPPYALSQQPDPRDPIESEADEVPGYRALVMEAVAEYEAGHWTEAELLFRKAHALDPNARTQRGMGMAAYEGRRYLDALRHFEASLANPRKPLTETQRHEVRTLIEKADVYVARLRVNVSPAHAEVRLDGHPVSLSEAGELLLDAGHHELTFSAPGYREVVRRTEARPGRTLALQVTLLEAAHGDGLANAPSTQPRQRVWTWVAAGSAAAFLAGATTFYLVGRSKLAQVEQACEARMCDWAEVQQARADSSVPTLQGLMYTSAGIAGAALLTAGVLFFVEGIDANESKASHVRVGIGSIEFSGRF